MYVEYKVLYIYISVFQCVMFLLYNERIKNHFIFV